MTEDEAFAEFCKQTGATSAEVLPLDFMGYWWEDAKFFAGDDRVQLSAFVTWYNAGRAAFANDVPPASIVRGFRAAAAWVRLLGWEAERQRYIAHGGKLTA